MGRGIITDFFIGGPQRSNTLQFNKTPANKKNPSKAHKTQHKWNETKLNQIEKKYITHTQWKQKTL